MAFISAINGNYITLDAAHVQNMVNGAVLGDGTIPRSKLVLSAEGIVACAGVDIDTSTNTATIRSSLSEMRGNVRRFMTVEQFGTVELPSSGFYGVFVEMGNGSGEPFVSTWAKPVTRPESLFVFGRFFDTYFSRFPLYVDGNLMLDCMFDIDSFARSVNSKVNSKVDGINALTNSYTTLNSNTLFRQDGVEISWSGACTARLNVTAGEEIVVSGDTFSQKYDYWGYAFFSGGSIMSDTKYQGEGVVFNDVHLTVPDGADEIRVNGRISGAPANVMAHRTITDFAKCMSEVRGGGHSILYMGDSITQLGKGTRGWPGMFHTMVGGDNYVNTAVIGARWCDYDDTVLDGNPVAGGDNHNNTISNQVEKISRGKDTSNPNYSHVAEYDSFDTIIIAAGTNDVNTTEGFDTQFFVDGVAVQTDSLDRMTWCGAMRYAYDKLRGMYPDADIFICTPIQGFESTRAYDTINTNRNRIKRVCDRISDVTLIDTFSCGICGVYEAQSNQGRDLIDGLHPNESGARKIARYNAREYLKFYGSDNK